jgi:hypothetical protein
MNIKEFSEPQQMALLDLAILGMYSDGHLASVEDARVQRLLATMGFDSEYDRNKQYDAAVSRVARHSRTVEAAEKHATTLAQSFTTREHRRGVHDVLADLLASDSKVAPQETNYLAVIGAALQ